MRERLRTKAGKCSIILSYSIHLRRLVLVLAVFGLLSSGWMSPVVRASPFAGLDQQPELAQEGNGPAAARSAYAGPIERSYPLIGWQTFGGAVDDFYARHDLLVSRNKTSEFARRLRSLRPDIKLIYTADWNVGCEIEPLPEEWILRKSDGTPVESGYGRMLNVSDFAPSAASGRYAGKSYLQACAEHMTDLDFNLFHGIATDGMWGRSEMYWIYRHSNWSDVDIDNNGVNDHIEHSDDWFLDHWQAGIDQMLSDMRQRLDVLRPGLSITVNSGSGHTWGRQWTNGIVVEKDRGSYNPTFDREYFQNFRAGSMSPFVTVADGLPDGDDPDLGRVPTGESRDHLIAMRYGLVTAMFNDVYFSFQDLDEGNPHSRYSDGSYASQEHYWTFWYDEFEVDLGMPTGEASELKAGLWYRCFDEGIALANPDGLDKTVTAQELDGLCGYSGSYYRLKSGQDLALRNVDPTWEPLHDGSRFTSATLKGQRIEGGGVTLYRGDGLILFRQPTTSVSDLVIDNNYMSTSPTNQWVESEGFQQEDDCRAGSAYYTVRCAWNKDSFAYAWAQPGSAVATYRANIGLPGRYEVFEWHGELNSGALASNVRHTVHHQDGEETLIVDQSINAGGWNSLGVFNFDAGTAGKVLISAEGANGPVMADAVKFVYRGEAEGSAFVDVPSSHWAFEDIHLLHASGYVAGCSSEPPMYCPERTLTRAEAAVFVGRGVHGAAYIPDLPGSMVFEDVPLEEWFAKWVNSLWQDGYTQGCETAPRLFCPLQGHTRAEAMVFFLRMLKGKDYLPSEPSAPIYLDVPVEKEAAWFSKWIHAAHEEGLVQGCEDWANRGDLYFRPFDGLTRAEAACMMVRAKGLRPFDHTAPTIYSFEARPTSGGGPFTFTWAASDEEGGSGLLRVELRRFDGSCASSSFAGWNLLKSMDPTIGSAQDNPSAPGLYCYSLRLVDREGNSSTETQSGLERVEIQKELAQSNSLPVLHPNQGNLYRINLVHDLKSGNRYTFGDLDGDGLLDPVVKSGPLADGHFVIDAYSYAGELLWSHDSGLTEGTTPDQSYIHEIVMVWDMDASNGEVQAADGKWEVIYNFRMPNGGWGLRIVNGKTGETRAEIEWPKPAYAPHERHYGTIAYLDGINPYIVVAAGLYQGGSVYAYDRDLNLYWKFDYPEATGSHWLSAFDFEGDGVDEIVYGGTVINADGTKRWAVPEMTGEGHVDVAQPGDIVPGNDTTEVFYCAEHGGTTLVVDQHGTILWRDSQTDFGGHCHTGWAANVDPASPGDESCAYGRDRGEACYRASGEKTEIWRGRPFDPDGDGLYSLQRADAAGDLNGDGGEENWEWSKGEIVVTFGTAGPSNRRWGNRGYMLHLAIFNSGYAPYEFTARNFGPTFPVRSE